MERKRSGLLRNTAGGRARTERMQTVVQYE